MVWWWPIRADPETLAPSRWHQVVTALDNMVRAPFPAFLLGGGLGWPDPRQEGATVGNRSFGQVTRCLPRKTKPFRLGPFWRLG